VSWDDPIFLTENRDVRGLNAEHIKAMFGHTVNQTYVPLTSLSFAIEHHFFGYNPFVYHLDNILLHLAVCALVYLFCLQLGLSRLSAGIATIIFGLHPLRVESVAWVTERKDVLYAFFYMLALNHYCRFCRDRRKRFFVLTLF